MTITTLEEHDEAAQSQSEPSSPVLGLNGGQQGFADSTDSLHEMKFEMRTTKVAPPRPLHDRVKSGPPKSLQSSPKGSPLLQTHLPNAECLSGSITRSQSSSLATNKPNQQNIPHHRLSLQTKNAVTLSGRLASHPLEKEASVSARAVNVADRSISTDAVDSISVLPTRTRLRRQRRMGSQDSAEQSEDPMERLNRLRARISGALSEVKGVLNKYSTETEPSDQVAQTDLKLNTTTPEVEQPKSESGPIQFRFVKKIRRRSLFSDDGDDKVGEVTIVKQEQNEDKATDKFNSIAVQPVENEIKTERTEKEEKNVVVQSGSGSSEEVSSISPETIVPIIEIACTEAMPAKTVVAEEKTPEDKKDSRLSNEKSKANKKLTIEAKDEKRRVSIGTVEEVDPLQVPQSMKTQRRPSDSVTVVKKHFKNDVKLIGKSVQILEKLPKRTQNKKTEGKSSSPKVEGPQQAGETAIHSKNVASPKEQLLSSAHSRKSDSKEAVHLLSGKSETQQHKATTSDGSQTAQIKSGKRLSVKKSDSFRRSSIAAVESSKIEPPVVDIISTDIKAKRRPSDSQAIFIKKSNLKATDIKEGKPVADKKPTPKGTINNICRTQTQQSVGDKTIEEKSKKFVETLVAKTVENSCKDGAVTSSADDKQAVVMLNHSIKVINNEASIPSSTFVDTSPSAVIGRATKATTTSAETAITTSAEKTEISVAAEDSKFPLISDGLEIANVEVPISLLIVNEAGSQQAQSDQAVVIGGISEISAVSLKKSIPFSTDNVVKENIDPNLAQQAVSSTTEQAVQPLQAKFSYGAINHAATKTENPPSIGGAWTEVGDDIKKPIHQREIIPAEIEASSLSSSSSSSLTSTLSSPLLSKSAVQDPLQQTSSPQQVSVSAELAVIAIADDICVHDRVPDIFETTPKKSLSEVNAAASSEISAISKQSSTDDVATKTSAATGTPNSGVENITTASEAAVKQETQVLTEPETRISADMPELQVLPPPVKALQVHTDSQVPQPFGESKDVFPKKKVVFKKVIRKSSTSADKPQIPKTTALKDKVQPNIEPKEETDIPPVESTTAETIESTENAENAVSPAEEEHSAAPKPARKVKKKVIIKRLQRRLSGSEQTFFLGPKDEKTTTDVETLEKPIAYVTDDEENEETPAQTTQPLRSCMRLREYQVGDWVMYAERYKKTQIRWKKGRVTERITSISYKLDIDGKEVSAHINYLKKYTGRNVRFGGKEYLEIDYEQIADEEEKARNYSIWNLV